MSEGLEWRTCPFCDVKKYCPEKIMIEHQEDCPKRPSQTAHMRICPRCHFVLEKVLPNSWICINNTCDFQVDVLEGRQLH